MGSSASAMIISPYHGNTAGPYPERSQSVQVQRQCPSNEESSGNNKLSDSKLERSRILETPHKFNLFDVAKVQRQHASHVKSNQRRLLRDRELLRRHKAGQGDLFAPDEQERVAKLIRARAVYAKTRLEKKRRKRDRLQRGNAINDKDCGPLLAPVGIARQDKDFETAIELLRELPDCSLDNKADGGTPADVFRQDKDFEAALEALRELPDCSLDNKAHGR